MAIKADRWIRRMALEQGMIEPFVERQVRTGIISYGLSSYGYDMRVSDEFKVFTNVFNTVVDPKHFDPRSFVDIRAEYCDIPPNSFALARSVEYFRIPRNVACLVLGKSTYARCFSGDTRLALVDGTSATLEDMAVRSQRGEQFWGYSVGPSGRVIVTLLERPRLIGRDSLLAVTLDNGEIVRCTPDHDFMLRDGRMVPADSLRPGTSLMPLYTELFRGYEGVYQPMTGHYTPTHRLADEWNLRHDVYEDTPGTHRHHIDHERRDNNPWNIVRAKVGDHGDRSVFKHFPEVVESFRGTPGRNHKVTSVRELAGQHDVFCLTVPEAGNFALAAGVFVRNCGIIINITPLEPAWEGHVTIEISNTTPLPARIYANEGIGQVLFFEGDEPPEVSYADKQGKYQGQQGVVLPRIDLKE